MKNDHVKWNILMKMIVTNFSRDRENKTCEGEIPHLTKMGGKIRVFTTFFYGDTNNPDKLFNPKCL
mgnify:CR=1 FL=1